ncbi:hypothetical protein AB0O28_18635 [Microbispora sp. NPDC088329]|uniref:hypothetical protein n=1 Tax=Microbispora sp. NPDC088329 TaxID=3154869 RepID=UPI00341F39C7
MEAGSAPDLGRVADAVETFASEHPVVTAVLGVLGLALLVLGYFAARGTTRAVLRPIRAAAGAARSWAANRPVEDRLTIIAASIATGVSAQGMWRFSGDVLGFDGPLRLGLFAFIEVAVVTSAVRARRSMREDRGAGLDGLAVWIFTCLSAVLSTLDARSVAEAIFRLAAPLVAAWLWERGMAIERHRITGRGRIHWRLTPERVLVRLGLAEATDRTAEEVDAQRRLDRVALAADNAHQLREAGASERKQRRAYTRLRRAFRAAAAHTGLARDPEQQEVLRREVAVLRSMEQLLDVAPESAWAAAPVAEPEPAHQGDFARLAEETRHLRETLTDRHETKSDLANVTMLLADLTRQRPAPVTTAATAPAVAGRVASQVAEPPLFLPREWTPRAIDAASAATAGVTGSAVTTAVTSDVTDTGPIDLFNPAVFDPACPPPAMSAAPADVTPAATANEVTGEVGEQGEQPSGGSSEGGQGDGGDEPEVQPKTKIMRDFWDQQCAEGRYPSVTELAEAAGSHHSLASKNRKAWVDELPWWQRRKAQPRREKVNA